MRAAVCERYGPPEVVSIREVPAPEPGDGEVLIRATATTVNSGDARMRAMNVPTGLGWIVRLRSGLTKPRQPVLGFEVAGRVESVGSAVTQVEPGDRVIGSRGFAFGCHAEKVVVAGDGVVARIPDGLPDEEAVALCFGGATAQWFFQKGQLAKGETVLVNGASGAVGTMAVQLAKHAGAEVTGVCSGDHADLVRSLGADHVVDYNSEDFTRAGRRYDVVMDTHGNAPYSRIKGSLAEGGRFLMVVGNLGQMVAASWQKPTIGGTYSSAFLRESYGSLLDLAAKGEVKAVIDSVRPFDEIVEAYRRVDGGHKAGSVVLTHDQSD
jgi:2-desacetyl-2-hydroxyethyl bacteriochlorophyllide A dehydrogenase